MAQCLPLQQFAELRSRHSERLHVMERCRLDTINTPQTEAKFGLEIVSMEHKLKKLNSLALVRDRTVPTERLQLVGEVIANFVRIGGATWAA
jgi:hypothetical protein